MLDAVGERRLRGDKVEVTGEEICLFLIIYISALILVPVQSPKWERHSLAFPDLKPPITTAKYVEIDGFEDLMVGGRVPTGRDLSCD